MDALIALQSKEPELELECLLRLLMGLNEVSKLGGAINTRQGRSTNALVKHYELKT
jgi:hypothetical protein